MRIPCTMMNNVNSTDIFATCIHLQVANKRILRVAVHPCVQRIDRVVMLSLRVCNDQSPVISGAFSDPAWETAHSQKHCIALCADP